MGPLSGVRVVEMAGLAPGPFGCMLLADLGADVIRIDRKAVADEVPAFGTLDRGRRIVEVDLKSAEGPAVVKRLAACADIFVEGFRPGVAERLGIGPEDLLSINERLIYGRMTGWGQQGPLAQRAGHDINYIALAGLLEPIGHPGERPRPPMNVLGDFAGGGMLLALGVLAALVERSSSGSGQIVDAAMIDGSSLLTTYMRGLGHAGLWSQDPGTNLLDGAAPFYDTYETADGRWVAVGCIEPKFYAEFVERMGISDVDVGAQNVESSWPSTRRLFAARFLEKSRDGWEATFAGTDACVTPVLAPHESPEHPHNLARQAFHSIGGYEQPAPAPRFSRTELQVPTEVDRNEDVERIASRWESDDPQSM